MPTALLGALLFWGGVSAAWSIMPGRSVVLDVRLAGLFAAGLALVMAADRIAKPWRMLLFLLAGTGLGLALAGYDLVSAGGLTEHLSVRGFRPARLNQIAVGVAILLLPTTTALFDRGLRWAALATAVAIAMTVCLFEGTAAKIALLGSLPVAAVLYLKPRLLARAAAILSVLAVLTAPVTFSRLEYLPGLFAVADSFKDSAGHRVLIWWFAGQHIAERPLLGWGLDSSRAIPGGNQEIRPGQNWLPLHPHNAALQVWLELGLPGGVVFAAFIALLWLRIGQLPRRWAAAAGGSMAATLAAGFAAYGVWQEWWIGTLALSLFLTLVLRRAADPPAAAITQPPRRGWRGVGR